MNPEDHLMEVKRVTLKDVTEYEQWITLMIKDIVRIEQSDNIGIGFPNDGKERIYILTKYDGLFVLANYKEMMGKWIDYIRINGIE